MTAGALFARAADYPDCLGRPCQALDAVVTARGAAHSAPETVALAEALFQYLGSLWLAEYVADGARDPGLNRYLIGALRRPVMTGQWVMLGRWARALFTSRKAATVNQDLRSFDFGDVADTSHPVTRLITYRNHFAHGSFSGKPGETARSHSDLRQLFESVPALIDQCPRFRLGDSVLRANSRFQHCADASRAGQTELLPYVLAPNGDVLDLYPLLYVERNQDDGSLQLRFGGAGKRSRHPTVRLLERDALAVYMTRYRRERAGFVDHTDTLDARRESRPAQTAIQLLRRLMSRQPAGPRTLAVHPGCGAAELMALLPNLAPRGRYDDVAHFVVDPAGHGSSGLVFANFLLRRAEAALDLPPESLSGVESSVLTSLETAADQLSRAGKRVLVGVLDLHLGMAPAANEDVSIADVCRSVPSGPIDVVATISPNHPNLIPRPVTWGTVHLLPMPEPDHVGRPELARAVDELVLPPPGIHQSVFDVLVGAGEALDLFQICERLEDEGSRVLTPEVERTLAELGPLLRANRAETNPKYAVFSQALVDWAMAKAGP